MGHRLLTIHFAPKSTLIRLRPGTFEDKEDLIVRESFETVRALIRFAADHGLATVQDIE